MSDRQFIIDLASKYRAMSASYAKQHTAWCQKPRGTPHVSGRNVSKALQNAFTAEAIRLDDYLADPQPEG